MKLLVLGCNGMAGHTITLYMKEKGHEVLGFDRSKSRYVNSVAGDAHDTLFIKELIEGGKFDSVINCIGILNQYAENNKAVAVFLNSYFPHYLAECTKGTDTQIIHMSTDCVFSGKRGSYNDSDFPDGEKFYDRTKALGELKDDKNITLRNSIVGPDINTNGIGLLNWFMKQKNQINGYVNVLWTGLTTLQLAKTMEIVAKEKLNGLYNSVPQTSISKFELCRLFNHYLRSDTLTINPVEVANTDKSLVRSKVAFIDLIPDYELMISEMAEWVFSHKEMYPHYNL